MAALAHEQYDQHSTHSLQPNLACNISEETVMNKYGPKAQAKIHKVMEEFDQGKLKSSSGQKVVNRKQAVAIGISEARHDGYKTPNREK
jgi:hypothetical protein